MVEITSGVSVGAKVALDARARGIADFEDDTIEINNAEEEDEDVSPPDNENTVDIENADGTQDTSDSASSDQSAFPAAK
jgi:hypothetical protein